jgi:phosphatidylserine/phosphatidylglycerophosphate/cardiolipin synthase-like enzyme
MYEFKDKEIADALIAAARRGLSVRVLLNQGYYGAEEKMNQPAYDYLETGGVSARWTPSFFALTHQKTLITDNDKAFIMTFNFAPAYYATARDFGVLDADQNDVKAIENTFNNDWNNQNILPADADDLVWSPEGDQNMLLIINSAKKELDIYNEEMADPVIIGALENAARRGVAVNIIMTYQSSFKDAFAQLKNAGAVLRLFHGEKFYIHAKMILADKEEAFLGSQNFSYTSLNKNRELGIFLSDPSIINMLAQTFSADWRNAVYIDKLFRVDKQINIFERAHGVAGGDIVLMVKHIGAVAGRPDAGNFRFLIARVDFDSSDLIQRNNFFHKVRVRNLPDFHKNAGNFDFFLFSGFNIFINYSFHKFFAQNFQNFRVFYR